MRAFHDAGMGGWGVSLPDLAPVYGGEEENTPREGLLFGESLEEVAKRSARKGCSGLWADACRQPRLAFARFRILCYQHERSTCHSPCQPAGKPRLLDR